MSCKIGSVGLQKLDLSESITASQDLLGQLAYLTALTSLHIG